MMYPLTILMLTSVTVFTLLDATPVSSAAASYGTSMDSSARQKFEWDWRVPSLEQSHVGAQNLAKVQEWSSFRVPSTASIADRERVWMVNDNVLSYYSLARSNMTDGDPIYQSPLPLAMLYGSTADTNQDNQYACSHPVLSSIRDPRHTDFHLAYILCRPNVILTVSLNHVTGAFLFNSQPPIFVKSPTATRADSAVTNVISPPVLLSPQLFVLPQQSALNRSQSPSDLLIVANGSGGGSILVIDSRTGLSARKTFKNPYGFGNGTVEFTVEWDSLRSSYVSYGIMISNSRSVLCHSLTFIAELPSSALDEWKLFNHASMGPGSCEPVQLFVTPDSIYHLISNPRNKLLQIQRHFKSSGKFSSCDIQHVQFTTPEITAVYERQIGNNLVLLLQGKNNQLMQLNWSQQRLRLLGEFGRPLAVMDRNLIYFLKSDSISVVSLDPFFDLTSGIGMIFSLPYITTYSSILNHVMNMYISLANSEPQILTEDSIPLLLPGPILGCPGMCTETDRIHAVPDSTLTVLVFSPRSHAGAVANGEGPTQIGVQLFKLFPADRDGIYVRGVKRDEDFGGDEIDDAPVRNWCRTNEQGRSFLNQRVPTWLSRLSGILLALAAIYVLLIKTRRMSNHIHSTQVVSDNELASEVKEGAISTTTGETKASLSTKAEFASKSSSFISIEPLLQSHFDVEIPASRSPAVACETHVENAEWASAIDQEYMYVVIPSPSEEEKTNEEEINSMV